jgi:hypothetical protein
MLILRTLFALDPDTNLPISTNYVVTTDGIGGLTWLNPFTNLSTAGTGVGYLPSTIDGLRSNISSISTLIPEFFIGLSSLSTVLGQSYISSGIYTPQLLSTTEGLGTLGYISTSQLQSTVVGLGSSDYVSSSQLVSSIGWILDPSRYISTGNLISSVAGVLPVPQLTSSLIGLGSLGYVSTSQLTSTVEGISTLVFSTFYSTLVPQFTTPSQIVSTVEGLGTVNYISTTQLTSTMNWLLDNSRYVSTGALVSTAAGLSTNLQTSFFIDNAGNLNIYGGTTVVSSATAVVFLSTFVLSSLTYEGSNGTVVPVRYPDATTGNHILFSSAKISLDKFSSYILNTSQINLEFYPTFVFPRLNTGATSYSIFPMSTLVAYGPGYLSEVGNNWVYAGTTTSGFGNLYQQPIQLQIPGSQLQNKYQYDYRLVHNVLSSATSNLTPGFVSGNIEVQFGSTNSVFLSIQNLP